MANCTWSSHTHPSTLHNILKITTIGQFYFSNDLKLRKIEARNAGKICIPHIHCVVLKVILAKCVAPLDLSRILKKTANWEETERDMFYRNQIQS
jgi:hypothetical protein